MGKMTKAMEKDLIMYVSLAQHLDNPKGLEDWWPNPELRKAKAHAADAINALIGAFRYSLDGGLEDKEMKTLKNKIENGGYFYGVYTKAEQLANAKRKYKTDVPLNYDAVMKLVEWATYPGLGCTEECKLSKKACSLRPALLKIKVPPLHNEKGICEFKPIDNVE
jgi:hypothetical protein